MEVAGVVLGGIPILLYALDNYARCLTPIKKYLKYEITLGQIQSHVFIQQEQLRVTLRNIGLHDPTHQELHQHLLELYDRQKCAEFMSIISNMEKLVFKMMDKLDLDSLGKPRWTTESKAERINWEWRRVRRSFGSKEQDELRDQLQYWNTALQKVFEKVDIPAEDDDPHIGRLQARFNHKHCDAVRANARALHDTLARVANSCHAGGGAHQGLFQLDWHMSPVSTPGKFTLALSMPGSQSWKTLLIKFPAPGEEVQQVGVQSTVISRDGSRSPGKRSRSRSPSPPSLGRQKWRKAFWKPSQDGHLDVANLSLGPISPSRLPVPRPPSPSITCFCECLQDAASPCSTDRMLPLHDHPGKNLVLETLRASSSTINSVMLKSLLADPALQSSQIPMFLSRRQRFAIAAAASWGVLYLCGSPWLGSDCLGKDEMQLPIQRHDSSGGAERLAEYPTLTYNFSNTTSTTPNSTSNTSSSLSEAQRFQSNQIRNKTLFALGILLIELCLNKSFEQLRRESQTNNFAASMGMSHVSASADDLEIAGQQVDKVYLDAGHSYGYAVQRCLRCEFPGRDVTKDFNFREFRRHFFNGVVAPVQAAFETQPSAERGL